ncbi:MAG TPA: hypothetical protein VI197_11905 [Polyangiaceae bacterium]
MMLARSSGFLPPRLRLVHGRLTTAVSALIGLGLLVGCGDSSAEGQQASDGATASAQGTATASTSGGSPSAATASSASAAVGTTGTPSTSATTSGAATTGVDASANAATTTSTSAGATTQGSSTSGAGGAVATSTDAGTTGSSTDGGPIGEFPTNYEEEDTGADCPEPPLPGFAELPEISYLPDPFLMADGTPMTTRAQWRCRRAEIKAMLEKYDVGEKPGAPTTFQASLNGNTLNITVGEDGETFDITAPIARPDGAPSGPIPAIIGINTPTGSLPANLFSERGIATITFTSEQLAPSGFSGGARGDGNFYRLYPGATAGFMIRWAWGVSRIIDALYALPEANIDVTRLAVSGCSYQGKIALYAGAFDERIALTIPHESGGGGTISWRYSDMLEKRDNTEVENLLHAQGAPWYAEALMQFNDNPDKLPFDHHELIAMVAPRAFLAIESTAIARMGAEAARIDALAAREMWTALGVPHRMGATEENVNHCVWHDGFTPDLEAYLDEFLLGDQGADTDILRSKFTNLDTETWIPWETPTLE